MGNCLQATETEDVDLLQGDHESVNVGGRRSSSTSTEDGNTVRRQRSHNSETANSSRPTRSSRRRNRNNREDNNDGEQLRQRRSSDSGVRQSGLVMLPSYEVATMQRSSASDSGAGASSTIASGPVYHPSPGVSRPASELTEEEQIKIAQRIGLIQHLPIDIYVEGNKTYTECIICFADFTEGDKVRYLPCMHTYHVHCIDEWLMRSFSCPSCLEPVDSALLSSYDQQQMAAFTTEIGLIGNGSELDEVECRSLPRQLNQLTAVMSPTTTSATTQDDDEH